MALLNFENFSKFVGVTRVTIQNAVRKGQLEVTTVGEKKRVDTKNIQNKEFYAKHNNGTTRQPKRGEFLSAKEKFQKTLAEKKNPTPKIKGSTKPAKAKGTRTSKKKPEKTEKKLPKKSADPPPEKQTARYKLELKKTEAQLIKLEVETSEMRRQLISRTLIKALLGNFSQIDRNEILTIGDQIAPDILGMLGVDDHKMTKRVAKLIVDKCYKALLHKQRLTDKFLKEVKAGKLADNLTLD